MIWCARGFLMMACLLTTLAAVAAPPRVVRLATLEWPPYNSTLLPAGGVNTALVRKAFEQAGYRLEIEVLPWNATIRQGLSNAHLDGYFPVYLAPNVRRSCFLSERVGSSSVVLAKRQRQTYVVRNVSDLTHYLVGVVRDYNNTEAFDANVRRGVQKVEIATSDEQNLLRLVHGRVDMIMIDHDVMRWLLTQPSLRAQRALLDTIDPPLQIQGLYICFQRTARGQQLADSFSGGLRRLDAEAFTRDYLRQLGQQ